MSLPRLAEKGGWVYLLLIIAGLSFSGQSLYIFAKAQLAQQLIAQAWQRSLQYHFEGTEHDIAPSSPSFRPQRPWPWADTWPVAQLRYQQQSFYVLEGAQGESLAFGPGRVQGSASIGASGTTVLGGHRDTHFSFLASIKLGELLQLQDGGGNWHRYKVVATEVHDSRLGDWQIDSQRDQLHLITCYPFAALVPGGPLRYVVVAEKF